MASQIGTEISGLILILLYFAAHLQSILLATGHQTRRFRPQIPNGRPMLHLGPNQGHRYPEEKRAKQSGEIYQSSCQGQAAVSHLPQSYRIFGTQQKSRQIYQTHSYRVDE